MNLHRFSFKKIGYHQIIPIAFLGFLLLIMLLINQIYQKKQLTQTYTTQALDCSGHGTNNDPQCDQVVNPCKFSCNVQLNCNPYFVPSCCDDIKRTGDPLQCCFAARRMCRPDQCSGIPSGVSQERCGQLWALGCCPTLNSATCAINPACPNVSNTPSPSNTPTIGSPTPPPGFIRVDDKDSAITYVGPWGTQSSGGFDYHYVPAPLNGNTVGKYYGAYATYTFSGDQIMYTAYALFNRGWVEISIDGTLVDVVNYSGGTAGQRTWTSPTLSRSQHTIKIAQSNNKVGTNGGRLIALDYFDYRPLSNLSSTPPPGATATPSATPPPISCPTTSTEVYDSWGLNPPDPNAESNPEIVLKMRGWAPTSEPLTLITYGYPPGAPPDPKAPQLNSILRNGAQFSAAYKVHKWDYATGQPSPNFENAFPVSLLGLWANPGQVVRAVEDGYTIGAGYQSMLIYASQNAVTLNITGDDSAINGYALHLDGFCVDPNLLALYKQLHSTGRQKMPVLRGGQKIGVAKDSEVRVSVRDSGSFMDPRSKLDWWQNVTVPTTPPGATNTPPPVPTATPSTGKTFLRVNVHMGSTAGALFNGSQTGNNPYDGKHLVVYMTGPTSKGGQFGEQLFVPGVSGTPCKSKTGFSYACGEGFVVWKGADGVSGTTPGGYSARVLTVPSGWEIISSSVSDTGNLSPGSTLTLNLAIRLIGNQPTATPDPNASPTPSPEPTLPNPTATAGAARATGDVDGNGIVNIIDYLYYTRAVTGGTIPSTVDPDVNSDGHISPEDRTIIVTILKQQKGF